MRKLVLIHGRAQEDRDATALKRAWLDAFHEGLDAAGLELTVDDADVRFPYYGDTLRDLDAGMSADEAARIIIRGEAGDVQEQEFLRQVLREVIIEKGVTDAQIAEVSDTVVVRRGPQNWEWIQAGLRAIDRFVPGASGGMVALVTRDVYRYLRSIGIRDVIESGVRQAMRPDEETVVVAHSLGTVVAYNLLLREGEDQGWKVPLFVTLGSPLGITAIRRALNPIRHPAVVSAWFNAFDERDVVALYPLDTDHFDVDPAIDNWRGVRNETANRHGIAGYLSDARVAQRIHDALNR